MTPEVVRSPLAERFLEERGIAYELKVIPIADIDREASHHNQARIKPVDTMLVERYQQSDEAGAVFPAIIVGKNGSNKYIIADGIHRVEAKVKNRRPMVWAYAFDYESEDQFRAVSRTANAILNGRDNSEEERLMHAAAFLARGVDRKTAAVQCGVSISRLGTYITGQTARQRFAELGIGARAYAELSDKNVTDLSAVLADGAVRKGLEMLKAGIPMHQITRTAREARDRATTEAQRSAEQLAALSELEAISKGGSGAGLLKTRKDTLNMRLRGALKVVNEINASGRRDEFIHELRDLRDLCDAES